MVQSSLRIFFLLLLTIQTHLLFSQQSKYFISFKDKSNTPYSLNNPSAYLSDASIERREKFHIPLTESDLPVDPAYVQSVANTGATVLYSSKWLNGVLVLATSTQLTSIESLSFVNGTKKSTKTMGGNEYHEMYSFQEVSAVTAGSLNYGSSFNQFSMIGVPEMHAKGYTGKGVLIAVIDGGFQNVNALSFYDSLMSHNRVIATYDFVDLETDVYDDHFHGTNVLSLIAAYEESQLIGAAWQSDFILLRSEEAASETLSEEYNWVKAAEYADSAGVYIISSSLGYNQFINSSMDHVYQDLNGDKTVVTIGADLAASKGILVINSAGNEGNTSWQYIVAPADGDSVLTVGGVTALGYHSPHSSFGPTSDGRIKPDVVAQSSNVVIGSTSGIVVAGGGTSCAAPMVTGLAAGLWQAYPELTPMELNYYIKRSASRFGFPDNEFGYGIPNFTRAAQVIESQTLENATLYPNPVENQALAVAFPLEEYTHDATLYFYDLSGKLLEVEKITSIQLRNELKTNVSVWNKGLYIVKIITPLKEYFLKFCKL